MHRVAYGMGIVLFLGGIGAAILAWWQTGLDVLYEWVAQYRPEAAGTPWVWLGLGDFIGARIRQTLPLALPVLCVLAIGMVEGCDWRSAQRMRGHHAHLLGYAAGCAWAVIGWWLYAVLRPEAIILSQVVPPCLLAAGIIGFAVVVGLPGRGTR